jgi:hypothetical protein
MKTIHEVLEKSALPILIIILIPIGFFAYAYWSSATATPSASAPAQASPVASPAPSASISLDAASTLPQAVSAGQFVPFSFTITNTGTNAGDIPFKVYVKWSTGEEDVIDENVVSLAGGSSKTVSESLKFEVADEGAQVFLELTQSGQTVQFALPRAK